jgi:transposase
MSSRYQKRKYNQLQLKFIKQLNAFKDRFKGVYLRSPNQEEVDIWMAENRYLKNLGDQ